MQSMDLISRVLKKIMNNNPGLKQGLQDAQIMEAWPLAVGTQLAKHCRAVQVKGKTLFIEVDHPIWKKELHANKSLALKRLNDKLDELLMKPEQKPNEPDYKTENKTEYKWVDDLFLLSNIRSQISTSQTKSRSKPG
jgi:Dna[CI] antecedent, DciA